MYLDLVLHVVLILADKLIHNDPLGKMDLREERELHVLIVGGQLQAVG